MFTLSRAGVYVLDAVVRADLRSNGDGAEVRWLLPASIDPSADVTHPFGITDSDRFASFTTQSVPAFSSVTVAVPATAVPVTVSVVAEAPNSFLQFGDGWARVTLIQAF